MYSYEERLRAVRLYIKLGRRMRATLVQLGYPTKNALKSWHREYERHGDLRAGYARQPRFSQAQKERAVEHYLEYGRCLAVTTRALGYPSRPVLRAWLRELHPATRTRVVGRSGEQAPADKQTAVIALCMRQGSVKSLAQQLGVSRPTLYNWATQLLGQGAPASMKSKPIRPHGSERAELQAELERLRREVQRLQLEQDILKKANELLKKDLGVDPRLLSNRQKTQLVDALRATHRLAELLQALGLPRSSYFYHRARAQMADKYAEVRATVAEIFKCNYRCYGYRRLHAALGRQALNVSEKVVRRLMKEERLVVLARRRRRYGSYMGEIGTAPDNLLNRDFRAQGPNEKWLTDLTEFQIPAGKVYLSPMIDCYDGMVVSWSIGTRPDAELVNTMLDAAIQTVATSGARPVVHSDRGGHYRWPGWLTRISDAKLVRSMSRKGCSPDNAACEGFFGRLKNELFYSRDWMSASTEQFIATLDAYIRWYNDTRIKGSLGFRSPLEYRRDLGIAA